VNLNPKGWRLYINFGIYLESANSRANSQSTLTADSTLRLRFSLDVFKNQKLGYRNLNPPKVFKLDNLNTVNSDTAKLSWRHKVTIAVAQRRIVRVVLAHATLYQRH